MPSKREQTALNDIGYFIDLIEGFVAGFDYPRFADDLRTFHTVTRCLEIISEASRRISDETKDRHPAIQWREMAAAANKYRHDYEDVAQQVVWATVQDALPLLRTVVMVEFAKYPER